VAVAIIETGPPPIFLTVAGVKVFAGMAHVVLGTPATLGAVPSYLIQITRPSAAVRRFNSADQPIKVKHSRASFAVTLPVFFPFAPDLACRLGTIPSHHAYKGMASKPKIVETGEKLKGSAVRIKDSAAHMERSTARVEDSADRRTELAADRTVFAAERTYAAWVRTGLVAMASGIGAKALLMGVLPQWLIIATGSILILFSVFCFGAGVWRHLYPGPPPPVPDVPRMHPALLLYVNGILALVSIAALIGIWFG
jgi:putative membrane protein